MAFPSTTFVNNETVIDAVWLNAVNEACQERLGDVVHVERFSGNGTQTQFVSTYNTVNEDYLSIYINGAYQQKNTYTYDSVSQIITFSEAPPLGTDNIEAVVISPMSVGETDASLVQYDPPFVGSVATTVENKLAQTVSVKDFGAVGDGVTDDTAAIQAALDSGANTIVIPNGTFIVDSIIINNNTNLIGLNNNSSTIKRKNGTSSHLVVIDSKNNITLDNIKIDGNQTLTSGSVFNVYCNNSYNLSIKNCKVVNSLTHGIDVRNGTNFSNNAITSIDNCEIYDNLNQGINISTQDCLLITNCSIHNNKFSGINSSQSVNRYLSIANNFVFNNTLHGINIPFVSSSVYTDTQEVIVESNQVYGNGANGIAMQGTKCVVSNNISKENGTTDAHQGILVNGNDLVITNNVVVENSGTGIDFGDSFSTICSGNFVKDNQVFGIEINSAADCILSNNFVEGNQQGTAIPTGSRAGIIIYDAVFAGVSEKITITGNIVKSGPNQEYGLLVSSSVQYVSIASNYLRSSGSIQDCKISTGTYTDGGGNTTYISNFNPSISSASTTTIEPLGNYFKITGTTTINTITTSGNTIPPGRIINLFFSDVCSVGNATGNVYLASPFTSSVGAVLVLIGVGSNNWREVSRS